VYEAIANLAALPGAPADMADREQELLHAADVVITGGPTLYRALEHQHPFVRAFPSSVDSMHFERRPWVEDPCDQDELAHPRLGYFGAIDERIDLGLLDAIASKHPDWQVVLVGPILRISPSALPSRPNLHVLGGRSYAELPAYAAWWDIGLIPYVLNPLTQSINPSQTLEYLAADLPVVTTPIDDVVELYGELVHVGDTADSFIAACESALSASAAEKARRRSLVRNALHKTSWDETVHRMEDILRYVADTQGDRDTTPSLPAFQGARL
jgi:glycosyltransferase involved in cell wall biosynthesis